MTTKSSGLRTSSYGSQQQQQTNGAVQNHAPLLTSRKLFKLQVAGIREKEKERWIPFMCRYLIGRKGGMVILVCVALLAFASGVFTVNKETADSFSTNIPEAFQLANIHESDVSDSLSSGIPTNNSTKEGNHSNSQIIRNKLGRPKPSAINPCKNFRFPPPPPPNNRRFGPRPCPVCYLPVEQAYASMPASSSASPVLRTLNYVHEENPMKTELHGGSDFGGYPSLKQRSDYFDVKESMIVHCGFVKGSRPGHGSGFDIDEADLSELDKYHNIIVASAIFGNYDVIQEPVNISAIAKRNVPFYMFVDEETEEYMRNKGVLNSTKVVGSWRIIVVRNVPYSDARRNGKVPKLLLHRLFPNVRFSIWIDGKLKLVRDPYQVVERFLWRENATFAISRHYKRFDLFVEAEANKLGGKYDNASIDYQVDFYRKEGSTPYSEAKLPITSDVPEGCVIIREHIPITNLFTCQWFNEVDRFTPRDQLSFSTVRDKIMAKVNWSVNMFLDCERRNFVYQAYHRDLLEHMPPPLPRTIQHRPPRLGTKNGETAVGRPVGRPAGRRVRVKHGRKSGSRRHRKITVGSKDDNVA